MFPANATKILGSALGKELPEVAYVRVVDTHYPNAVWVMDHVMKQHAPAALAAKAIITPSLLPHIESVDAIIAQATYADAIIGFGSGVVNDLCKVAAKRLGVDYICIPTAPSMNGYGARNASLIVDGHKTSVEGVLPKAILLDADILKAAPMQMIQAGFGDALSRLSAASDWKLAHEVKGEAYDARIYGLIEEFEGEVFANPEALLARDEAAILQLTQLLILEGFGMTIHSSSRPYSGGEHAIAHALEMLFTDVVAPLFHGELVAMTSVVMQRFQPPQVLDIEALARRAGLKTTPEAFGISEAMLDEAIALAPTLRERFGWLEKCLK